MQVWALDRRSQALEDTSRFRDALAGRITPKQAYDYYAGWIARLLDPAALPARRRQGAALRARLGADDHARRRPPRRAQGAARGQARDPRRPLARRVADRRVRELGLRRAPGLQGRRRPRAHRRRAARLVLDAVAGGDEEALRRPPEERSVRGPARPRPAVGGRRAGRDRRDRRPEGAHGTVAAAGLAARARGVQELTADDQPRRVRLRLRRDDVAQGARADPAARWARSAPTATGATARSRRSPAAWRSSARSPPTRPSGTSPSA